MTYGPSGGLDPESFRYSDYIIIWACNSVSTNLHHWHIVKDAQKAGAKVVVIDAYRSRTAKEADWHLAPRPGSDGALAMALIHVLIEEDLIDHDYVERHTTGFEDLAARAKARTPEWAAAITGIAADDIRRLAREYAAARAAAMRIGVALERHQGGGQTIRAVCCLPSLVGAWREVGGGILAMPVWEHPYRFDQMCRADWIPPGTRVISNLKIGRHLTNEIAMDPPILSMMCWNTNPVTQAPECDKIVQGLMREDLYLVVADHFLSDTARYADIVLPAAMGAEMEDIILSWGHNYLTYNEKCVEPPGECLSNGEIFRQLATRMGYTEERLHWSDAECLEHFIAWDAPACAGITLDRLRREGFARLALGAADERAPHREGRFPTPSGKCEFKSSIAVHGNFVAPPFRQMYEAMQGGEAVDAVPDYVPPRESRESNPALAARYPLNIVSPKSHGFLNSCYANIENKLKGQGEQFVLINAIIDACRTPRGIGKQGKGALADMHPQHLAATVLKALAERNGSTPPRSTTSSGAPAPSAAPQGNDLGRMAALDAGYDVRASGMTLDRFCGSGITTVNLAAASDHVRHGRPGHRRRHRDDEPDGHHAPTAPASWTPATCACAPASAVAPGRVRRRHRHAGRHPARGARRTGAGQPAARRAWPCRRPLQEEPGAGLQGRRHAGAGPRGVPAPADHPAKAWPA
jgi:hypothetical protein